MAYDKRTLDALRSEGEFGEETDNPIYITPGAADVIDDAFSGLFFEFMTFDNWDPDWDAEDKHEIGIIDFDGTDIMFKITPLNLVEDTYSVTFLLPEEW
jgi:hypothetical protein|tara:strand:+ start:175 stop:471 length:297 start_codon:yes stop_codon:yes gene_type:complete